MQLRQMKFAIPIHAVTVHLRKKQHRDILFLRQLLQCFYNPSDRLVHCLVFGTFLLYQMKIIDNHQVAFLLTPLQFHLGTDIGDTVSRRMVKIQRQLLKIFRQPLHPSQVRLVRSGDTQTVRIYPCITGKQAVQGLQCRHLQTEETDMFPRHRHIHRNMHGYSRLTVTGTSGFHSQFAIIESAGHIIESLDPRQDTHAVGTGFQTFAVHLQHLLRHRSDLSKRFTDRTSLTQRQQLLFRLSDQVGIGSPEVIRLPLQSAEQPRKYPEHITAFHLFCILFQVSGMPKLYHPVVQDRYPVNIFPMFFIQPVHLRIHRHKVRPLPFFIQRTSRTVDKRQVRMTEHLRFQYRINFYDGRLYR